MGSQNTDIFTEYGLSNVGLEILKNMTMVMIIHGLM